MVLDEPNSNLDDHGEKALIDTVKGLNARGKTTLLVTHRTSILEVVTKIMALRDGTVVAFGPRDELLPVLQGKGPPPQAPQPPQTPPPARVAG